MAIDFPDSPSNGDIHTVSGKRWEWDGEKWTAYGASLAPDVLKVDVANNRVGINDTTPSYSLDVTGTAHVTGAITASGGVAGALTGNADTATALATARTIGGTSFDGTANINLPGVNATGNQNTSGTAATVTDAAQSAITSVGTLTGLTISGDLTVGGTTTTINSTTLTVDDKNIELGSVASPSDTTADGGGITLKGASDKTILWENDTDTWDFNQGIRVGGHTTLTRTPSGEMSIFGHNVHVDMAEDNKVLSTNTGYYGQMIRMYYNEGITFHTVNSTVTAGNAFYTAGGTTNEVMRIANDGKVGIGTAAPPAKLSVDTSTTRGGYSNLALGAGGDNPQMEFYNTTTSWSISHYDNDRLQISSNVSGSWVEARGITIKDATGNVGIGTTAPAHPLHVGSNNRAVCISDAGGTNYAQISATSADGTGHAYLNLTSYSTFFKADGNHVMAIRQDGTVGIGVTSPSAPFHVYGSANSGTYTSSGTSNTAAYFKGTGTYPTALTLDGDGSSDDVVRVRYLNAGADKWQVNYGTDILWHSATWTERMRLTSAGNLTINGTTPVLTIKDTDSTGAHGGKLVLADSAGTEIGVFQCNNNDDMGIKAVPAGSVMYIWAAGAWQCKVWSTGFAPYLDNTQDLGSSSRRWDDVYATNTAIQSSDERDKANITDLDYGLSFVNNLRPVSYTWDSRDGYVGNRTHMGFVAQEVATVMGGDATNRAVWIDSPPEENKDADTGEITLSAESQGLRYNELIAPMVKAIQELTTRLEALESA